MLKDRVVAAVRFHVVLSIMRTAMQTMRAPARRLMSTMPTAKPACPNFSSGPCAKRPGYDVAKLVTTPFGRSHRAKIGKAKLAGAISETKELLMQNGMPSDYHVGIVPASDTGAVEMAMWAMLGPRPVTMMHFENFGGDWFKDLTTELKLENVTNLQADYGKLPDLDSIKWDTDDVVFTYNGTTSGVKVPESWSPPADRAGLAIADSTSAVFAMNMPWANLDVVTFSWQKCMGGEGAHGMLILSPRAVERLESYTPPWPMPKIFRMVKKGKLDSGIFGGATINTPSMLANEDYLDALEWGKAIGGYPALVNKSMENLAVIEDFVAATPWMEFLSGDDKSIRSNTSVCLKITDLDGDQVKKMTALLEKENVALDVGAYRSAPAGLRIWCGPTVEKSDLEALMPWLSWAHDQVKA